MRVCRPLIMFGTLMAMMTVNLVPVFRYGPFFDVDAVGWRRVVPRRVWWPVIPALVLGAPVIACVLVVDAVTRPRSRPVSVA